MTAKERVKGRKIGIVGMARSGMAAARLIRNLGGTPFVTDTKTVEQLTQEIADLEALRIDHEFGGHTDRILESDFVIISPGVPLTAPIVQKIQQAGIPIFSEIELASWYCRAPIVAITGSNGKTTTTTLVGEILGAAGLAAVVCGNIGYPFSDAVINIPENGVAVLEVSSFQLELIEEFRPHIAMILNLTPDHLDRYEDFAGYCKAKYRIAENMQDNDWLILNADDHVISQNGIKTKAQKIHFSITRTLPAGVFQRGETLVGSVGSEKTPIIDVKDIRIPGPHNLQNAAAAALAALLLGVEPRIIGESLRIFPGVEHRMEAVDTVAGIRFINDSKATNVDSVCYALRSVDAPVVLIAGGREKGGSYAPIIDVGKGKIKEIVLIGEGRENMFEALGKSFPVQFASSMEEAVTTAFGAASPGEIVMLSPACASFDMFRNYEHRGEIFKKAVAKLKTEKPDMAENSTR